METLLEILENHIDVNIKLLDTGYYRVNAAEYPATLGGREHVNAFTAESLSVREALQRVLVWVRDI